MRSLCLFVCLLASCAGSPNAVLVELSPSLISSLDGTTTVTALVAVDSTPLADESVDATVTYTDRNGTPHAIAGVKGRTNERGVFETTIEGLIWDGTGTVTIATNNGSTGAATFTVLDRTPPAVEILPPTSDLRVGPGLPLDVQVKVTDEIGVSEVIVDDNGVINGGSRRTIVASGSQDATLTFRMDVNANATAGPTITLYAIATDLSGNIGVAKPVTLTVDPSITIATPPGLTGSLLVTGTMNQLADPRGIAWSPKDNHLYIADVAGAGACNPSCVWRVDPTSGAIDAAPVHVGTGDIEGVAIDATGDNLFVSDRQDRISRLSWTGSAYATPVACIDSNAQQPQDPYHLLFDATLGIVVADDNDRNVQKVASCMNTSTGTAISAQNTFDQPRGVAVGPAGQLYVSDNGTDRVSLVNTTNGNVSAFASNLDAPYGIEWLAGGTSAFADSLMIASQGGRTVMSATATGTRAASYLRNEPIDLTISAGTMYILTSPSANNRGRVYKVSGF